jgi:hypothetical protein
MNMVPVYTQRSLNDHKYRYSFAKFKFNIRRIILNNSQLLFFYANGMFIVITHIN